jgi:import receptor subunit TOM22
MVKVEEVRDAAYAEKEDRESDYATTDDEDGFETESVSSIDSEDDFSPDAETLADRFYALKDIVAPSTRTRLASQYARTASWLKTGLTFTGNAVWVVTTSALLVGLPLALAMEDEARIVAQEKELQMQQSGQQSVSLRVPQGFGGKRADAS